MKRIISLFLVSFLILAVFSACGNKNSEENMATEGVATAPATATAPAQNPTENAATPGATAAPTEKPTDEPAQEMGDSLAISLAFDENGNVSNGVAGGPEINPYQNRNIGTLVDATAGRWVCNMTGGACFYMASLADLYDSMTDGFALELYFNLTKVPTSGYWAITDNCEVGGFGMEIHPGDGNSDAILKWNIYIDAAYYTEDIPVNMNEWTHVIASWDGNFVRVYLNGQLFSEYDSYWGEIKFTSIEEAWHLAIGACCAAPNTGGNGMVGLLSVCNLYTSAVNPATAQNLFADNTKANAEVPPATEVPTAAPTEVPTDKPSGDPTDVTEPTEKTEPTQDGELSDSLIISLAYDNEGKVSNGAKSGPALTSWNDRDIESVKDEGTGKWASRMPGGAYFYMASIEDYYDALAEGFSLELYFNLTSAPSSGYWGLVDNCEAGGMGMEIHPGTSSSNCTLKWNMFLDTAYDIREFEVELNTWNHVIVTWDGSVVKCYLNGKLVDEYDSNGAELKFPPDVTAHHLAIGACCAAGNTGGNGMVGYLSICNLFTASMSAETVAERYGNQ